MPSEQCSCSYSAWIAKVWEIIVDYRNLVEICSIPSDSPRSKELCAGNQAVVLDGRWVAVPDLRDKLQILMEDDLEVIRDSKRLNHV